MYRNIDKIIEAPFVSLGPHQVRQAIPTQQLEQFSPFILLHHFDLTIQAGEGFKVPPHPHRGFCPITYMFNGRIKHKDSLGNEESIGSDEVQWINAGSGLLHSEEADEAFTLSGGRFQGIQLWINIPASEKMNPPSYLAIRKNQMPVIEEEGIRIQIVSGTLHNQVGPAPSPVTTAMMHLNSNASYTLYPKNNEHVAIYILEGTLQINETKNASSNQFVLFETIENPIALHATENTKLLFLAGQVIHEPLVSHGPFVMNSYEEISAAIHDYQDGKMGILD